MAATGGKNIILLSDGTGNSAGKLFKTNVWRVYDALDLSNASQVAFYDDGVGTSSLKPLAVLGGVFGWGLKRNVLALYGFLCRNYQPGDRIYAFGFSRGAFTIRVLIKFILAKNLIGEEPSSADFERKALRLYREFRSDNTKHYGLYSLARPVRDIWIWLMDAIFRKSEYEKINTVAVPEIEFLGLWDTVAAYGIPIEELSKGIDRWIWPLSLDDKYLDGRINKACHALSIDDQRTTFQPLLWDETDAAPVNHTDREKLTQVWFSGVHANVGGGYPDDGMSYVPLRWIIAEARKRELRFNTFSLDSFDVKMSPYGRIYNSRAGFGAYYRYGPRRLDPACDGQDACIPCPKIHESVFWRVAFGTDSYAPISLPDTMRVVVDDRFDPNAAEPAPRDAPADGWESVSPNIMSFEQYRDAVVKDGKFFGGAAGADDPDRQRLAAARFQALNLPDKATFDLIWDTVWWRRVAYYSTLYLSLYLLLLPALVDTTDAVVVKNEFVELLDDLLGMFGKSIDVGAAVASAVAPLADIVNGLVPIARPWIDTLKTNPILSFYLIGGAAICFLWGKSLDRRIQDRSFAAWDAEFRRQRVVWLKASLCWRYGLAGLAIGAWIALAAIAAVGIALDNLGLALVGILLAALFFFPAIGFAIWWVVTWRISKRVEVEASEVRGPGLWFANRLRNWRATAAPYRFAAKHVLPHIFAFVVVVVGLALSGSLY